jgi:hypothetical protein
MAFKLNLNAIFFMFTLYKTLKLFVSFYSYISK